MLQRRPLVSFFFFFNDTATTEIYTLSLHDALPIFTIAPPPRASNAGIAACDTKNVVLMLTASSRSSCSGLDRKSTRLNSSHLVISYAVFCLKKKKNKNTSTARLTAFKASSYGGTQT